MNISLTPELERMVRRKVKSGMYTSSSEVVREALRLLDEREHQREQRLQQLKAEIAIGMGQSKRGEVGPLDVEKIKSEVRRRAKKRKTG